MFHLKIGLTVHFSVCVCDSALTCFFAPFDKNGLVTLKLLLTPHFLEEKILVRFSFL